MPRKPRTTPAPEVTEDEVEDLLDDEVTTEDETDEVETEDTETDELDDLEVEDEVEDEPAPKKRAAKAKAEPKEPKPPREVIQYGSAWLADHVNEQTGSNFTAFGIRTLLRKLVKDGKIQRDVGEDRSRYNFTAGAKDPVVREVIKYVKSGDAEKAKREKIAEAKAAAKVAEEAKPKAAAPKAKAKAKPAPEPVEDDEDDEEIEDL